jgi:pantetheine-phosphate adenylyltransferase
MSKRIVAYPGSFDPITNGHLDVIERALRIFDKVIVGIGMNSQKPGTFSVDERVAMITACCKKFKNVEVKAFDCLAVEFAKQVGAVAMLRGLRSETDFSFEFPMAMMNRRIGDGLEIVFIATSEEHSFISSSLVKEVARLHGDVSPFVPKVVSEAFKKKYATSKGRK